MFFDTILFASGRKPNVNSLGLDKACVDFDQEFGIFADKFLQTSNKDIYAVGDCLAMAHSAEESALKPGSGPQFTHNSDVHARNIFKNAFLDA